MEECMNGGGMHEWTKEWMDGWINEGMNGGNDECMNGWMNV